MKKILFFIVPIFFLQSCSEKENKVKRNHEILNIILKDRLLLEKRNFIYLSNQDTIKDTIRIRKIELVASSYTNVIIDSVNNFISILDETFPITKNYPFKISSDSLLKQIKHLTATAWESDKIDFKIPIERKINEDSLSCLDKKYLTRSYLIVSEPLIIGDDEILVLAKLFNFRYTLNKLYEIKKRKGKWEIARSRTMVSKFVEDKTSEVNKKDINYGKYDYTTTYYSIFLGYSKEL